MSWTDNQIIKVMKYLKDKYKITTLIETGTYKGINAELHSKNFERVLTCEKVQGYYIQAKERLKDCKNVVIINEDSAGFISHLATNDYMFYLDAHFYEKGKNDIEDKFAVLRELKNAKRFKFCPIIIHDFDNGLGHINYDGIRLDMKLLNPYLKKINKNFFFYTNRLESCNPVKPTFSSIKKAGLNIDAEILDNLEYAWRCPRLTYRGILYCLPSELSEKELNDLGLREWN